MRWCALRATILLTSMRCTPTTKSLLIDESTESGLIAPEQNEFVDNIFDIADKDAESLRRRVPTWCACA